MADKKGYVNTDELHADDEISPRPARNEQTARGSRKEDDAAAQEVPRPATSE